MSDQTNMELYMNL